MLLIVLSDIIINNDLDIIDTDIEYRLHKHGKTFVVANPVSSFDDFYTGIGLINSNVSNNPGFSDYNGFCMLISVLNNDLTTGMQIAFPLSNNVIAKFRNKISNVWSEWSDLK